MTNLLTNAFKFTNAGFIEFGYYQENIDDIIFYVSDSGIGIEKKNQDKIFNRFTQADEKIQSQYGGTGLGLSISAGYVELMGGKIWVESEPEKGSVFYFTIPFLQSPVKD